MGPVPFRIANCGKNRLALIPYNEIEIEGLIKSNLNFLDKEIGREYELPALLRDATERNPVEISEFLSHLHLDFLDETLQQIFPRLPRIKNSVYDLLPDKIEDMFYEVVAEIEKQLKRKGKWIGKAVEDATIIRARRGDEEAKYNGYYKAYGWKKDLFIDYVNKIFLSYKDME